ncbi:BolA family protein [Aureimonas mangrovi]|uniref:BolA family protein n=1 Tax=Aureimonas mangrovi TaxID=2758041 RepID=UPI00163D802F|nr:BolA family protein [Aureimonas mangrovi]
MSVEAAIRDKLQSAFAPTALEVVNESHLHAGHHHDTSHHAPFDGAGETHFRVRLVSQAFEGKSRLDRHRAVNAALSAELAAGVHALAIEAKAPGEPSRR